MAQKSQKALLENMVKNEVGLFYTAVRIGR